MSVHNFIKLFVSYQQCTRFRKTLDFDCEYLRNGSSDRQAENGVTNYDFSTFDENNSVNFRPLTKKRPSYLTYDLEIQ